MYAKIHSGVLVGVMNSLPSTYQNISGFDSLSDADILAYGFYPLEEIRPALAFNSVDDGDKDEQNNPILRQVFIQQYGQPSDDIQAAKVIRTYSVIDKPTKDIKDDTNRVALRRIDLLEAKQARAVREAALGSTGPLLAIEAKIIALRAKLV